jgi:hypothetical protein
MVSLPHVYKRYCNCVFWTFVVAGFLGVPAALGRGETHANLQANPWSVYSWGGEPWNGQFPPSCHELGYFSGSPLRFAFGGEISKWQPGSFTFDTKTELIGTVQGHQIYQVVQNIHPDPGKTHAAAQVFGMKRVLVERGPNEFCMIFQEQGWLGPSATIGQIDAVKLTTIYPEPLLFTDDYLSGNVGAQIQAAWTFDHGTPISLLSLDDGANSPITRELNQLLPHGCVIWGHGGNGLDLKNLTFESDVWKPTDSMGSPTCGHVSINFGIRNHRLVVLDKKYTP